MQEKEIIFFGTNFFGKKILATLLENNYHIKLIVTQSDKPVGRKQELLPTPVKLFARNNNLPVATPSSLKDFDLPSCDLGIVAEYGLIIPEKILNVPNFGMLNVHTSLLPKYRGASPIQTALINGETETGVTIMQMDKGMDTGPILIQEKISLNGAENFTEINNLLADIGSKLLIKSIPKFLNGNLESIVQDNSTATYTKIFKKDDGKINWQRKARDIFNLYRGLHLWPGVWTIWNKKRVKLLKLKVATENAPGSPGFIKKEDDKILVECQRGSILIEEIQIEGGKQMLINEFINGYPEFIESKFEN